MKTSVFVSYSHDNEAHKEWVRCLCNKLNERQIDTVLDQTHLKLGGLISKFQEEGIHNAQRVLVVCSIGYVKKIQNHVESGVGQEKGLIDNSLFENQGSVKFIPVIRDNENAEFPPCMIDRLYVDFRDDLKFDAEFERLVEGIIGGG